jgi:hypothetical protein
MRQTINFDDLAKNPRKMDSIVGGASEPTGIKSLTLCHLNFPVPGVPGIGSLKKIKNIAGDVEVFT